MFSRPRAINGYRRSYTGEYRRKRWENQKERGAADEREETAIAVATAPRFFDIEQFLSQHVERNYCLGLLCQEKGKLIAYLNEKGADQEQIATVLEKLQRIVDS